MDRLNRLLLGPILASVAGSMVLAACSGGAGLPLRGAATDAPLALGISQGTDPGWPQALHDARHSGEAVVLGPQNGTVRWRRSLGGPVLQGPVVSRREGVDTVFVGSGDGVLHAIDPVTGTDRWDYDGHASFGGDLTTSAAVLADGTVLWPGPQNRLYVIDGAGRLLATEARNGTVLSPAVVGPRDFYLVDSTGELSAYRLDGLAIVRRWSIDLGDTSYGSPVVAPDGSLRQTVDDAVVALRDAGDHAVELWRYRAKAISEVSAGVAVDGTTIFGTNDGYEYGLDLAGAVRWKVGLTSYTYSSPAVTAGGLAVFGDNNGLVQVVRVSDGTMVRRLQAPAAGARDESSLWSSPVVDALGDVYYGTRDGSVYGYDPSGRRLFAVAAGAATYSTPAITPDGTLVIGTQGGLLLGIGSPA